MRLISSSKWKLVWRRLAGRRQERKREVLLFGQRPDLWRHLGGRRGQVRSSVWLRQGRSANAHAVSDPKGSRLWDETPPVSWLHGITLCFALLFSCGWTTWTRSWGRPRPTFWSDWRKNGKRTKNKNHDGQRSPRATDTNKCRIPMQQVWFQSFFFFYFHFSSCFYSSGKSVFRKCDNLMDCPQTVLYSYKIWHETPGRRPLVRLRRSYHTWHVFRRSCSVFSRGVGVDMDKRLLQLLQLFFAPPQSI